MPKACGVVEAAGVEPASKRALMKDSTGISCGYFSHRPGPQAALPAPVPLKIPPEPLGRRHGGYPANVALPGVAGLPGRRGHLKRPGPIQNRRLVCSQQFYEVLELGPHPHLHHSCRSRIAPTYSLLCTGPPVTDRAGYLPLGLALRYLPALVVLAAAVRQPDLELGLASLNVQLERH